jgi:hypothetical protein
MSNTLNFTNAIRLAQLAADPIGDDGALYYNTVSNVIRQYINGAWVDISDSAATLLGLPLNSANIVVGNGSNLSASVPLSGDATLSNAGVLTIGANKIVASNFGSGAATSGQALFADGSGNATYRSILTTDIPTLNQNTTGTAANVTGVVALINGGTGTAAGSANAAFNALSPMTTAGDVIFENATPAAARLPIGTAGEVLTVVAGLPAWSAPASSGTVTSVALTDASTTPIYAISGSPVTSSGTLDITLNTQAANLIFAGPASGSAAQPSFRSLVALDIPSLSATYVTQSEVGAVNGVAALDASGKVPYSQLPSALMTYKGAFSPLSNNLSTLDPTPNNGDVYRASVDGVVASGPLAGTQFYAGDFAIYNGSAWQRAPLADGVVSVNGASGAVTVNAINQLTGDATAGPASGSQSVTLTLATVNSNVGSFGSSTSIPSFTVNAKGLITAAAGNVVIAPAGTLSGTVLNATVVDSSLTSVGTIATGVWNGTIINIAHGGTGQATPATAFTALSPLTTAGDIIIESSAPAPVRLGIGSAGQVLTVVSGLPAWAAPSVSPGAIALTQNHILVGNASNLAADVAMSGDAAIVASGALTLATVNSNVGSFNAANITVNAKGLVTAASSSVPAGDIQETRFTAADNQSSPANVTGLAFANASVRSFETTLSIVRGSTYAQYKMNGVQAASSWYMTQSYVGDNTGLIFTITSAGQVQYQSTSTGNTALLVFRSITTSV